MQIVKERFSGVDPDYRMFVYSLLHTKGGAVISQKDAAAPKTDAYDGYGTLANAQNFYDALAADYLEGVIGEEEFYGRLEKRYYACIGCCDNLTGEQKQKFFNWIAHEAHNGILDYYLLQNAQEWHLTKAAFYYNTDYHYQHLEQKEKFVTGSNLLAGKLGLNGIEPGLNKQINTVNGRMSVILAGQSGVFVSLDVPPPPCVQIAIFTAYEPYTVEVWCAGKRFAASIPFSYDELNDTFSLASLLAGCDVPEKYLEFIENIIVVNTAIAGSNTNQRANIPYSTHSPLLQAVNNHDKSAVFVTAALC